MTTRGGGRDGEARVGRDGEARGAAGAERDAGDTNDELAGEDAKLRAMRSVWLSMREEEPSSGGLAELMAAARGKAAEMAPPPPWWSRVVAGLRRPPVLAFATVLVLLGGAMVVGRRLERDGAPLAAGSAPVAAGSASEPPRAEPDLLGGSARSAAPEGAGHGQRNVEQVQAALPPPSAADPAMDESSVPGVVHAAHTMKEEAEAKPRVIASGDRPPTPPASVATARSTTKRPVDDDERDANGVGAASAPTATRSAGAGGAPPSDVPASATPPRGEPASSPRPPNPTRDSGKADRAEHATSTKAAERRSATPLALYRQCDAAATRGDCAEVRRLVDQISTTDRRYRARVAPTSRIAKCLAE